MATEAEQPVQSAPGKGGAAPIPHLLSRFPDLNLLHRKAKSALALELPPDEAPLLVITGLASSAIVATNARAFVFKTGAKAGLPFAIRLKEFEFESILRVDLKQSGSLQVVVIHAPLKIGYCSSYWADTRDDPWRARNAIPVKPDAQTAGSVARFAELVDEFQRGMSGKLADGTFQAAARPTPDVLDRIARPSGPDAPAPQIMSVPTPLAADGAAGPAREDCPRCGAELSAGWQFCPRCGTPASAGRAAERRRRRH